MIKEFIEKKGKEFAEKFTEVEFWLDQKPHYQMRNGLMPEMVKSFHSQSLSELSSILSERIEEMYKFAKTTKEFMAVSGTDVGYNQALDDVLNLLSDNQTKE